MPERITADELKTVGLTGPVKAVEALIDGYNAGSRTASTAAIISMPFGGRDALVDLAADQLQGPVNRVKFDTVIDADRVPTIEDDTPIIVENAEYLFSRRIDGFAPLTRFLERVSRASTLVVTSWNQHAWRYLDAVRRIGDAFEHRIMVPPLDTAGIKEIVTAHADPSNLSFVDRGSAGRIKTIVFNALKVSLPWGNKLRIPYPVLNPAWLVAWRERNTETSIEAVVYEKLRRVSEGNPGVAKAVWDQSVHGNEIAPGDIQDVSLDVVIGDTEVFVLWIVVAYESVHRDTLQAVVAENRIDGVLQRLRRHELVTIDEGTVSLVPARLPAISAILTERGLLW